MHSLFAGAWIPAIAIGVVIGNIATDFVCASFALFMREIRKQIEAEKAERN